VLFLTNTILYASKTKADIFDEAFRKVKEATGVSDVNEVRTR
jgi:hypothetical protein